ncbi:hypothetical protein O181_030253 [Austropuccinia psidii MF-1]|uniref:Uncharacterized protein n=1 Tax=Austropuccinia psidii MF-1 TaxID=1389203 RepID=A0A9Q3H3I4_9BASI|nr:hypothetical protein [Austropuccinia psidii MF-1]
MVINAESPEKAPEQLKGDPDRRRIACAIISLNCNVKFASQFDPKYNLNPSLLWKLLEKHYLPKTLQNQASYLGKTFSTFLSESNLLQSIEKIQ